MPYQGVSNNRLKAWFIGGLLLMHCNLQRSLFQILIHSSTVMDFEQAAFIIKVNCLPNFYKLTFDKLFRGTWWHIWLRHCAGSIPEGVTGICHWLSASCRTDGCEYEEYFLGWKGLHVPSALKYWSLELLQQARPVQGLIDLYLYISVEETCPAGQNCVVMCTLALAFSV